MGSDGGACGWVPFLPVDLVLVDIVNTFSITEVRIGKGMC